MPIFGPKGIDAFLENGLRQAYAADIKSRTAHGKRWDGLDWDMHEIAKEGLVRKRIPSSSNRSPLNMLGCSTTITESQRPVARL